MKNLLSNILFGFWIILLLAWLIINKMVNHEAGVYKAKFEHFDTLNSKHLKRSIELMILNKHQAASDEIKASTMAQDSMEHYNKLFTDLTK
jgi:hypothetical protein